MAIALFGGTFDPFHNGHQHVLDALQAVPDIDQIILIPNRIPPHKPPAKSLEGERLDMVRAIAGQYERVAVSDWELNQDSPSWTISTVRHFRQQIPDTALDLVIGADNLLTFHTWREWDTLLTLAGLRVIQREHHQTEACHTWVSQYASRHQSIIRFLPVPPVVVSSTEIRACAARRESIAHLVPRVISEYIQDHHLYEQAVL